jgi:hypothetical protein
MVWDAADLAACETATNADCSDGFPVTPEKAYLIGRTEVTQGQWQAVLLSCDGDSARIVESSL